MVAAKPRTVLVLYGSETGNAQDIAEEVGKMCQRLHFESTVQDMDGAELPALLKNELVIFVISTTGQGDMPHNAMGLWRKLLRRKLPPTCLSQLQYTYFGLGDSTYLKFNWAARKVVRRLDQLGASTFFDGFEADEQFPDGIDGSFVRWADNLSKYLQEKHPHPQGLEPIPDGVMLPPRWSLEPALRDIEPKVSEKADGEPQTIPAENNIPPPDLLPIEDGWTATLAANSRVTPDSHWQDVRLLSFDIPPKKAVSTSGGRYKVVKSLVCEPGDCLTVYPKNFPEDVQRLITLMGWDDIADAPLDLSKCDSLPRNLHSPLQTTLRSLLLNNVDITAIPRRSFLKSMSFFSTDPDHKERLLEFNMPEYIDEYFDYATRSRRTIIEVLDEFTSVRLPAERLLDIFPLIRGRDFSIANGGDSIFPGNGSMEPMPTPRPTARVDLLAALVRYKTVLRKPRQGLCSRYFADMPVGAQLTVTHKTALSAIRGVEDAQRPLIAMATGTGVAPVRSLIQERRKYPVVGPTLIFFGNRNRAADYFFEDEWRALGGQEKTTSTTGEAADGQMTIYPAFSRDQREKVYVQDLIRREAAQLAALMPRRPIFLVCGGSSKMADACKNAVFEPYLAAAGDDEDARAERQATLDAATWWQEIW